MPDLFTVLCSAPDHAATEHAAAVAEERQRWENADGSSTVVLALADGQSARGRLEPGEFLARGAEVMFLGAWKEHPRWGWQFNFDSFVEVFEQPPGDLAALADYLARHCPGVGPATARRLVDAYGEDAAKVVCEDWQRLAADGHLEADAARAASEALRNVCAPQLREAHLALHQTLRGQGFWGKTTKSALRRWKEKAPAVVRRDPFRLLTARCPGAAFARCDRLWSRLGHSPARPKRALMAAWHAIDRMDGDTWAPLAGVLLGVRARVGTQGMDPRRALACLCRRGAVELRLGAKGEVWVAERRKARNERATAQHARRLMEGEARWPLVEELFEKGLSPHQLRELAPALRSPLCILTGGPGTGKTFCAAAIVGLVQKTCGGGLAVCAPTGKAAVRITEKMADAGVHLKATTIHKLLEVKEQEDGRLGFCRGPKQPLEAGWVVVDEVSMCDTDLLGSLLSACADGTHVLLVGDPHQLPPVGHGAPLRDLLLAGVPSARLTEIRRNAGGIVEACRGVKEGKAPKAPRELPLPAADGTVPPERNLVQLPWGRPPEGQAATGLLVERLSEVYDWLERQGKWDLVEQVQVICARNATRQLLNSHLQERLNSGPLPAVGRFKTGDKVICLKNGLYGSASVGGGTGGVYVANGDMGRVEHFLGQRMVVSLSAPPRLVGAPVKEVPEAERDDDPEDVAPGAWDLAYCCTCHKYQGSECPVVVVVAESAGKLASREWLYTALSRAKELCIVIGDDSEIARYVRNETLSERKTFLAELLEETTMRAPQ